MMGDVFEGMFTEEFAQKLHDDKLDAPLPLGIELVTRVPFWEDMAWYSNELIVFKIGPSLMGYYIEHRDDNSVYHWPESRDELIPLKLVIHESYEKDYV